MDDKFLKTNSSNTQSQDSGRGTSFFSKLLKPWSEQAQHSPHLQIFRYEFVPVWRLQTTICTASIFTTWLLLSFVLDRPLTRPGILLSISTSIYCALILAIVTARLKFKVSSQGIRTFNTLGRWDLVPWAEIASAVPAKFYFLPYLRLTVDGKKRSFWVPLFLNDMHSFRSAVIELAGTDNPLSQALPVPARAAYRATA